MSVILKPEEHSSARYMAASNGQVSKLATVRDLLVEAIEERHGGPFTNPIYPERAPATSNAKRWRETTTGRE